jgi:leader peptidase (prepilin peptidase)/N-methyltransferase
VGLLVVTGVLGLLIGALQLTNLRRLDYRRPNERHLPAPTDPWWVVPSTLITMTLTTARGDPGKPYAALVVLPLAVTGAWLSAVDLDVRRLPDRILMPTAVATVLAIAVLTRVEGGHVLLYTAVGVGLAGGCLWGLHAISRGGLGFGDVKLGAVVAAATSAISLSVLWWALMSAFTLAAAWALATRRRDLAMGPWLVAGALLASVGLPS